MIAELHSDTGGAVALSTFRCNPNHLAGHRDFLGLVHQVQKHKYLITQLVALVCGDKQTAVFYKRHIGSVEHGLVFNCQVEDAVAAAASDSLHRLSCLGL